MLGWVNSHLLNRHYRSCGVPNKISLITPVRLQRCILLECNLKMWYIVFGTSYVTAIWSGRNRQPKVSHRLRRLVVTAWVYI